MRLVVFFSCLFGLAVSSDVIELTDSDFEDRIKTLDTALVEFFAPWCGHCKKLAPEYEVAATALTKTDPPVPLVKVDCIANTAVCGKFGVSGYPTLKIFREGEVSADYQGPRDSSGIISYMKKQVEPASRELKSLEDFEKFTSRDEAVVIGFFSDAENTEAKDYAKLTSKLRDDYTFGHSYNSDVSEKAGFSDAVVLFRPRRLKNKFEEEKIQMEDSISESNLKDFLKANLHGLCGLMTTDNMDQFKKPLLTAYYDIDYVKNPKGTNYWRNRVIKVAKNHQGKLAFSFANHVAFSRQLGDAGISIGEKGQPAVLILDASDKKYVMESEFSVDNLEAFVNDYLDGKISPKIKSEDAPEPNDGPVKVVVGKTFDEIVMDKEKDVLVEFYAPWCGHCKSLAPKWDELGEKLKDNDDLVIAKVDATANDSPSQFQVSGFPTIYWAPKDNKENPVKYNGGREVSDFISYIEKHRTGKGKLKKIEL